MRLKVVPIAIPVGPGCVVFDEVIVRMSDPEAGRRLVGVEQAPAPHCLHDQVLVDVVLGLCGVLDEERVSLDFKGHVLHDSEVVCAVNGEGTIEALMHGDALDVRFVDRACHVEVDGVAAHLEGLTNIRELDVSKSRDE